MGRDRTTDRLVSPTTLLTNPPTTTRMMLQRRYARDALLLSCITLDPLAFPSFARHAGHAIRVSQAARLAPRRSASWLANLSGIARVAGSTLPEGPTVPSPSKPNASSKLPPGTRVYTQTKVLPFSQSQLFTVVADVDRYHEFLPFCTMSRVIGPADDEPTAARPKGALSPINTSTSAPFTGESSFTPPASLPPASLSTMRGPAARLSTTRTQVLDPITTLVSFFQPKLASSSGASTSATSSLPLSPPFERPEPPSPADTPAPRTQESQATHRAILADLGIGYGAFQEEYRSKVELIGQEIVKVRFPLPFVHSSEK